MQFSVEYDIVKMIASASSFYTTKLAQLLIDACNNRTIASVADSTLIPHQELWSLLTVAQIEAKVF